jgi:predicted DNA-binding transcriptional regulator AlpA
MPGEHSPNRRVHRPATPLRHIQLEEPYARVTTDRVRSDEPTRRRTATVPATTDGATPSLGLVDQIGWAHDRLIGIGDIREFFKLGRTAAYELTHRPEFPEPVLVSPRCYRWWASEVDSFAASLRRERSRSCGQRAPRPRVTHSTMPTGHITGRVRPARPRKDAQ